jgi:hypothetical protein
MFRIPGDEGADGFVCFQRPENCGVAETHASLNPAETLGNERGPELPGIGRAELGKEYGNVFSGDESVEQRLRVLSPVCAGKYAAEFQQGEDGYGLLLIVYAVKKLFCRIVSVVAVENVVQGKVVGWAGLIAQHI